MRSGVADLLLGVAWDNYFNHDVTTFTAEHLPALSCWDLWCVLFHRLAVQPLPQELAGLVA